MKSQKNIAVYGMVVIDIVIWMIDDVIYFELITIDAYFTKWKQIALSSQFIDDFFNITYKMSKNQCGCEYEWNEMWLT